MMSNLDQIALDVINVWEDSSATNHCQLKAELQVLIIEALKTCRNDALDDAVKVLENVWIYHPSAGDFSNNLKASMIKRDDTADAIKELKE